MMRRLSVVLMVTLVVIAAAGPASASPFRFPRQERPGVGPAPTPPQVSAPAWVLYDATLGFPLASQNPREMRAPASVTKIMTVLLALERGNPSDLVSISTRAAATGEREIGVWAGERVSLGALVRAAMVHSANDAATAIAEHIGGSVEEFAVMMTQRARELGMNRTEFVNPHGLDANGHVTTAEDMMLLAVAAMARKDFRDISRSRIVVFPDAPDGTGRRGTASNLMLDTYEGTNGIKTGFTNRAMLTFVASAERDGREIFVVVLGSSGQRAHFADARALLDMGFNQMRSYGTLAGLPHQPPMPVANPTPVAAAAALEALIHVAGEGLLEFEVAEDPEEVPPPPPPVHERLPETPQDGFWSAAGYFLRAMLGW